MVGEGPPLSIVLNRGHYSRVISRGGRVLGTAAGFGNYPALTEVWGKLRFGLGSCDTSWSIFSLANVQFLDIMLGRLREVINWNRNMLGLVSCVYCLGLTNWWNISDWDRGTGCLRIS